MKWWTRTKDWLRGVAGNVRRLYNELPSAEVILAETDAAAQVLLEFGDQVAALEPQDSRLLNALLKSAALLDFIAPITGLGGDKERALIAKVRDIGRKVGKFDDQTDAFWEQIGRKVLVRFIERSKALKELRA